MSTTDESVMDDSTESIAARPLIPSKPRLRFIDGAPDGGAGDLPADPDENAGDPPADPGVSGRH